MPLPDFGLGPSLDDLQIQLGDYGNVFSVGEDDPDQIVQPDLLRAPEVILGHGWSTPIDIWAVGCLLFEYITGAAMFDVPQGNYKNKTEIHLQRMIELRGDFPGEFLEKCKQGSRYFDENGTLKGVKK
ncbi:hypothetical protein CPB86DRAFT_817786 [Serendipita vermifera]|nr:hypothetical protein CPB86DRAFT_817786 [Serendipita vermifera]